MLLTIAALTVRAQSGVNLAWDPSIGPGVASYRVHYGGGSRAYTNAVSAGNATSTAVTGLTVGSNYYFAVTAIGSNGLESDFSIEVVSTVQSSTGTPVVALTSPVAGASYTAPASVSLAASVTANGRTISKVQFYNGTTLLGEDTSTPYAWTWSSVGAGSYSLKARAVYDAGSTVDSLVASISVTNVISGTNSTNGTASDVPAPWKTADIGSVGVAGSASESNGVYTVKGAGNLSGSADNFRFVYQALSGDGEIKARLNSVENTGVNGRVGVMIRETLTSGSEYAFMGLSPDGAFRWQRRSNTGGSTSTTTSSSGTPPNTWVRLVRTGNTLTGYRSSDGTNWTKVNSRNISMAANINIGFAVASGDATRLNTSTFRSMTVVP